MKRSLLLTYQLLTGLSDTSTGLLLLFAPALTLRLMGLHVAEPNTLVFLSYVGAFVLSIGLACLYGALLLQRRSSALVARLETVWLLTAITRSAVALFVITSVLNHHLESGWITVALSDGVLALFQAIGLLKGWLRDVLA
jgi:hypothetical protein